MSLLKKPQGYSSASPYLVVEGAQRVIDSLNKTLDAIELPRYDTVIMIGDAGGEWPAFPSWLQVSDVDATYKRALEAGAVSVQEPQRNEGDPDRRGGVKDPGGNTRWIATQAESL